MLHNKFFFSQFKYSFKQSKYNNIVISIIFCNYQFLVILFIQYKNHACTIIIKYPHPWIRINITWKNHKGNYKNIIHKKEIFIPKLQKDAHEEVINVSLATKRIWREESRKRRMEKVGTYSFDWISTKTLLRFVALVGTARKHGLRHEPWDRPPLFFLSFFSLPLLPPSVFKEESLPRLCVPPLLARRERGNYTDFLSFVGEGETIAGEPCN